MADSDHTYDSSFLIADAGGTKTLWTFVAGGGAAIRTVRGEGINAMHLDRAELARRLPVDDMKPEAVFFYGAGCATDEVCRNVREALRLHWPSAGTIEVHSDLAAGCRALLGDSAGIACILGTGSNSALYDGSAITAHVPSLGYILGDEGGGASLGKRLLSDWLKGLLSLETARLLECETGLSCDGVLHGVYRGGNPPAFLASVVPFIAGHLDRPDVRALAEDETGRFLDRNVMQYRPSPETPVAFTGGVAWALRDILAAGCRKRGLTLSRILKDPSEGLVSYHLSHPLK